MEINKIYLGDAYELIKQIPEKSVDLVYVDIPYLIEGLTGKPTGVFRDRGGCAYEKEIINLGIDKGIDYKIIDEFLRVLKQPNLYIWASKAQILPILNYCKNLINDMQFKILFWGKTNPPPLCNGHYLSDIEYLIFIKSPNSYFKANFETASSFYISTINMGDKEDYKHPTIKPLPFVKNHILNSCPRGGLVLDAFIGSGTTAVACKETGRNYIGFEINEEYYNIAVNRLKGINAKGEIDLFTADFEQLEIEFNKQKK